jgi:hypothetical protein
MFRGLGELDGKAQFRGPSRQVTSSCLTLLLPLDSNGRCRCAVGTYSITVEYNLHVKHVLGIGADGSAHQK